ncbi:unnamed protein product, partial [Cyprideis torosa]
MNPAEFHRERPHQYEQFMNEVNMNGISFPVAMDKSIFRKIRLQNPEIHFNVFTIINTEEGNQDPEKKDSIEESKTVIPFDLDPEDPQSAFTSILNDGHFVWIRSFSGLIFDSTRHEQKKWICKNCFHMSSSEHHLSVHRQDCSTVPYQQRRKFPKCKKCLQSNPQCLNCQESATLRFSQFWTQQKIPVMIVADFESFLQKTIPMAVGNTSRQKLQKHIPAAFGVQVIFDPEYESL